VKRKKIRLDEKIRTEGLIEEKMIIPMVMAGEVWADGQRAISPSQPVYIDCSIEIRGLNGKKYVGRGGLKLEAALEQFEITPTDYVCIDFGACTGGFTDVLLQKGAKKVYALETGKGILADKLRNDPRVINLEGMNLYKFEQNYTEIIDEKINLCVVDLSFIPLTHALDKISVISNNAPIIALLKQHYEAQDESLLSRGVVKDDETRNMIVENFKNWLEQNNYSLTGFIESPIHGGGGNIEYLVKVQKI